MGGNEFHACILVGWFIFWDSKWKLVQNYFRVIFNVLHRFKWKREFPF